MIGRTRRRTAILVMVAAIAVGVVGTAQARVRDSGYTGPKTSGSLKPSLFISGDKQAIKRLKATGVWCRWIKGHVWMRIAFRNRLGAHITVHVQPNYRLANAGLHGNGLTSQKDVGINANSFRAWFEDLGTPEGVSGTPKITKCAPETNGVDLG